MFDFNLNWIYNGISAILWFWHWLLSFVMNGGWGITWILAIILLTWTIKALLVKPTINQLRSARKMQEIQPLMQEIRQTYGHDQAKMAQEMRRVQQEAGFNPVAGCLPMLAQIPVFIGLFHVLRSFDRTVTVGGSFGHIANPMSVEDNANTANYLFSPELVRSFIDAKIFGVPLVTNLRLNSKILVDVDITHAAMIIVPLIAIIAIFTHLNARVTLDRQAKRQAAGKVATPMGQNAEMAAMQTKMMNIMMLWFMPATLIVSGFIWPIGLLFYMLANTVWTFVQSRIVYAKMDAEEEAEEQAKLAAKRTSAPKPGVRKADNRTKKQRKNR